MALRYRPDVETIAPDEQATIDGIIKGMTAQAGTVEKREGHAVRASHAKSSACAVGTLEVAADLAPELAQGLFAQARSFPVAVRFAQGPGETLGDRVSTHRGMAIKVFGVDGERLPGHDAPTQDFVLATGTTFPSGTAAGFLRDGGMITAATPLPEGVKSAVSSTLRNLNNVLHAFGTESPKADFFGHPLSDPYFSQAPVRWGDPYRTVARLTLPRQEAYGPERVRHFDEVMTFRPAHSLAAHRPLGSVMRARLQVYQALSDFRHRENGVTAENTADVSRIPA